MNQNEQNSEPAEAREQWLKFVLAAVLLMGLAARVGMAFAHGLSSAPVPGTDQEEYDTYAWNLAQGNGYRGMSPDVADQNHLTAYRPPGPSLLMAGIYVVAGHRYDVVRLVHCLLGVCSIWMVFRIGRECFDSHVGILAAAIYSAFPLAILQSIELLSEPLGVLLFLVFIDRLSHFARQPIWINAILAGLVLGCGLLTRANYVLVIPLFALWAIWQFRRQPTNILRAVAIPVVAFAILVPWTVRNYQIFGEVIPFSTMGGSVLLQGNNSVVVTDPTMFGYSVWDTDIPEYRDAIRSAGNEVERDRRAKQFAVQWIKENRDKWGFLVWHKFVRSWTPFLTNNPSAAHRLLYLVSWGPVLLLFVLSLPRTLIIGFRLRPSVLLLHLAILHYVVNSLVFFANIRYRAPVDPLCIILAAATITWLITHLGMIRVGNLNSFVAASQSTGSRPPPTRDRNS